MLTTNKFFLSLLFSRLLSSFLILNLHISLACPFLSLLSHPGKEGSVSGYVIFPGSPSGFIHRSMGPWSFREIPAPVGSAELPGAS